MPDKHPDTRRWGGPGASHEDRFKPEPHRGDGRLAGEPTNTPYSHVGTGGGERDRRHSHDPQQKRDSRRTAASVASLSAAPPEAESAA